MADNIPIPAALDEEFFEKNFEFGDDEESVSANFKKALSLFGFAYKATVRFAELAMNGECFESEDAERDFYSLALSYKYCREFGSMLTEPVEMTVVPDAASGSMQEYVNSYLKHLASCSEEL